MPREQRARGFIQAGLLVAGMVAFALPWRAPLSGDGRLPAADLVTATETSEQADVCAQLPPGHPAIDCGTPVEGDQPPPASPDELPPGHPPVAGQGQGQGRRSPFAGHPPLNRPDIVRPGPQLGSFGSDTPVYAL